MDVPGGCAGCDPPAFYGIWPRMAEPQPAAGPRLVAVSTAGTAPAHGRTAASTGQA